MTNLLHLVVALAEDRRARQAFREDPPADVADMTREDVAATVDLARIQVDPVLAERLAGVLDAPGGGDSGATAPLLALCDAVELETSRPRGV